VVKQGDIIWLNFDPQTGHEQQGRRPALVVSNNTFNRFSSLVMVCPITHTDKSHPFYMRLDDRSKTSGVILCDQVRMLDIYARDFEYIEKLSKALLFDVVDIINGFSEIDK
jgi:mRNA interferase MazF